MGIMLLQTIVPYCSFTVVHAFSTHAIASQGALEAHGTIFAQSSILSPCACTNPEHAETKHLQSETCRRHMASDDQSIMMFPAPLHQRQEAALPFYMCHAVGQCWVLPPASSMCILTAVFPKPHESHSMCLHTILELCVQSSACVRVSLMIVSLHRRMIMHLEFHSTDFMSPFFVHIGSSIL